MARDDDDLVNEIQLIGKGRGGRTGRVELIAACRRLALEDGESLETMVWRVMRGLAYWGANGDANCAKLFLQYVAKLEPEGAEAGPTVNVNIGPALPGDQRSYAAEVDRVIAELDLLQ